MTKHYTKAAKGYARCTFEQDVVSETYAYLKGQSYYLNEDEQKQFAGKYKSDKVASEVK